ncbi:GNAT family N-acetyltransferase [Carboxylicivirga sediminis]|uniref:GNAT family N-acetyltransferase n=1 Tax=Carboxylicivirga sediminis TaxID=2006564 RepID=A0A941F2J8_9BACT|nr:GNAT family protein [Carboxylicivirga sediminis]MBR8535187.1 GNAT family N-acetyltransferase [Carboxylicivirga sediminis]
MHLKTERLIIRPIEANDASALFKYRSDKEANKYQGWIPETIKDAEAFISKVAKQPNVPETWFQLVLIEPATQQIIGDIGLHFLDSDNLQVELGCTLDKEYQGNGFATEALETMIDYLFNHLSKHRIITSIDPFNSSSIKLVERLGFRKEAHFVQSLLINGQWVDDLVYAVLKKDWKTIV